MRCLIVFERECVRQWKCLLPPMKLQGSFSADTNNWWLAAFRTVTTPCVAGGNSKKTYRPRMYEHQRYKQHDVTVRTRFIMSTWWFSYLDEIRVYNYSWDTSYRSDVNGWISLVAPLKPPCDLQIMKSPSPRCTKSDTVARDHTVAKRTSRY